MKTLTVHRHRRRATASRDLRARAAAQAERARPVGRSRGLRAALALPALFLFLPAPASPQAPELVFISNITATSSGSGPLTTIEEQTKAVLDALGEQLGTRGLGYGDVVAMNVFLRDSRHFQAMNGIYRGYFAENPPTRATLVVDVWVYLTDVRDAETVLGVLAEVLPEGVPTTVAGLPLVGRLGVEIQMTAVVR